MTAHQESPLMLKSGIVLLDSNSLTLMRVAILQYNPETLTRTLQSQNVGGEGDRLVAQYFKAPPVETIKLDAEIDAADQLELGKANSGENGIYPQLAALETLVYPASSQLLSNNRMAQTGTLEIMPMEAPLTLFVWGQNRILPVRITDFSITEEAFDASLNPIRAKVSLGMRVLTVNDLGFDHPGGSLFMAHLIQKEGLATKSPRGTFDLPGIKGIQ